MKREEKVIDEKKNCKQRVIIKKEEERNGRGKEGGCVHTEVFAHCISWEHINKLWSYEF